MINNLIQHKYLLIFFTFIFFFIYFDYFDSSDNHTILSWDEINYSKSGRAGFIENAFEFKSQNFIEFIKKGLINISNKNILLKNADIETLKNIIEDEDIFKLRHYHPPLYSFYLSFIYSIYPKKNLDIELRNAHKIIGYSIILTLFIIFYLVTKNSKKNFYKSLLFYLLLFSFFYSEIFQRNLENLNYHTIFSLTIIYFSYSLYKYILKTNIKNITRLAISISLILISLETAIFVLFTSLIYLFFYNNKFINKNLIYTIIIALIIFIVIWPSNIYNLSLVKTYLMYFYRLFVVSGAEYSDLNLLNFLINIFFNNYGLIILFLFSIIIFLFMNFKNKSLYGLFLFNPVMYFLLIINFSHHSNYLLPSFTMMFFFLTLVLFKNKLSNINNILNVFIILLICFINFNYNFDNNINKINKRNDIFLIEDYLISDLKVNDIIISDDAHIFNYYLDIQDMITLNLYNKYNPKFYIEYNDENYDLKNVIHQKLVRYFIINKSRQFKQEQYEYLLQNDYIKTDFNNYYVFKLSKNS